MTSRENIGYCLICLLIGGLLGYFMQPAPETKIEQVEKEVIKKDIVTVVKEIVKPDGTKETTTTTTDKSKEKTDKSLVVAVAPPAPKWRINGGMEKSALMAPPIYSMGLERRVLGPVWLGVRGTTDKSMGVTIALEF